MKKLVVVTGGSGNLGSEIRKQLVETGKYEVACLDKKQPKKLDESETFYRVDLTKKLPNDGLDVMQKADYVIHCAATIYGVAGFNEHGYHILSKDVDMTRTVIENTRNKLVYLSSSMVYEKVILEDYDSEVHEDSILFHPAPETGYGLSKFIGEKLVQEAKDAQLFESFTIWRPFNIITPFEEADETQGYAHVFADFFQKILIEKYNPLPIIGDGEQIRCFTWYEEVAECIVQNLENPDTDFRAINIGRSEPITMKNLARMINKEAIRLGHLPDVELGFQTTANYKLDVRKRIPDVRRAKNLLGFEAKVGIEDSVSRLMEYWETKIK